MSGQVPAWFDLGYRINATWLVGGYAAYGPGFIGSKQGAFCTQFHFGCSAVDVRAGLQANYHVMPMAVVDPWFGLGIGMEWLTLDERASAFDVSSTTSGPELTLQVGVDLRNAGHVYLGPFLAFAIGRYSAMSSECTGSSCAGLVSSVSGDVLHEWLMLGLRGGYAP